MVQGDPFAEASPSDDESDTDGEEEQEDEVQLTSGFEDQLRNAIDSGNLSRLTLVTIRNGLEKVDDADLLREALETDDREDAQELFETRLNELTDDSEQAELDEVDEEEEQEETQEEPDDVDELDESEEPESDDDVEFESLAEADTTEEDASSETIEKEAEELEAQQELSESETAISEDLRETDVGGRQEESDMASEIDINDVAPNALTPEEAVKKEHRWSVLIWGPPGVGKTHFSYTMPEPVMIIDTEGKGSDIAHKFEGKTEFLYWDPDDYDGARQALHEALDALDQYYEKTGERGTIVVDSMSVMWGWSQQKYVDKYYTNKSVDDVEFTAGIGGGESDWKKIKDLHNAQFREVMVNSPYHLCWTAMREKDYSAAIEGNQDQDKPVGEKENVYKVDTIIHLDEDANGIPVGALEKSGLIKNRFAGLEHPTFPKVKSSIEAIDEAESDTENEYTQSEIQEMAGEDISIVKGNPRFVQD